MRAISAEENGSFDTKDDAWIATLHLRRSTKNVERLNDAIAQLEAGLGKPHQLIEPDAENKLI